MRWFILLLLLSPVTGMAQVVQNFSLTNVTTGQYMALTDFSSRAGIAIIFTSTDCPYDDYYLKRVQALADATKSTIAFLLINSNSDESMDPMKKYIDQHGITIPYLWDIEQKAMTALGAHKSPECFLLRSSGGKFTVVYKGAIDDNPQTADAVKRNYLKDAIENLLAKVKIEKPEVRPVGCSIR